MTGEHTVVGSVTQLGNGSTYYQGYIPIKALEIAAKLKSDIQTDRDESKKWEVIESKISSDPPKGVTREEAILSAHRPAATKPLLRPYRNKVLLLLVAAESQIGSLVVPDIAQVPTGEAIVIDIGAGDWDPAQGKFIPIPDLKVGDRVHIAKYTGAHIKQTEYMEDENGNEIRVQRTYYTIDPKHILNIYE